MAGDKYVFRGVVEVPTLSPYGFNDNVTSIRIHGNYVDPNGKQNQGQVIIYKDANQLCLSTIVNGPTIVSDVIDNFNVNGAFPNDSISSLRLFCNTRVILYKDINYGGDYRTYTNVSTYPLDMVDTNVDLNDTCSSLKVEYFY